MLSVLGIASIAVCFMLVSNSIMQAHGRVNWPIITMLIGGAVKVGINYVLVGNRRSTSRARLLGHWPAMD